MAINTTGGEIRVFNASIKLFAGGVLLDSDAEQLATLSRNQSNKAIFGTDLFMFADGELFVNNRLYKNKDLETVSGVYNYAQGITHRLMTARGTMPGDSLFGVPWNNYLGITYSNSQNIIRALIADITDELYKDSRTGSVLGVKASFVSPGVINVITSIKPVRPDDLSINIDVSIGVP
jgi:hypothetical protein